MQIEIFSDVICLWCYVGFARLERALAARPDVSAEVHWLPFELNPTMPAAGRNRLEYLRERFGNDNPFGDAQQDLQTLGAELGIDFQFDRIERSPNTRRAHMLIAWAGRNGHQVAVKRALLAAYFSHGLDIGDPDILANVAQECGLDRNDAALALNDAGLAGEVERLEAMGRSWNISGVPTFIFERRVAFSGAQPDAVFQQVFDELNAKA